MDVLITHDANSIRADKYLKNIHKLRNFNLMMFFVLTVVELISMQATAISRSMAKIETAIHPSSLPMGYSTTALSIMGLSYMILCQHRSFVDSNPKLADIFQYCYKATILGLFVFNCIVTLLLIKGFM